MKLLNNAQCIAVAAGMNAPEMPILKASEPSTDGFPQPEICWGMDPAYIKWVQEMNALDNTQS